LRNYKSGKFLLWHKSKMANESKKVVKIAWFGKYFWEEPALIGNKEQGTGSIFFSGCNLHCVFCQNYQISQEGLGKFYSIEDLVNIILRLQKQGVVSIDLVTPTIWWQSIKQALILARKRGLKVPVIWNSNAYEDVFALKKMEGLVDVYLPDFKYGDDKIAWHYSRARDYSSIAFKAIKEMFSQVGLLKIGKDSIAKKGLIVRHLVLPHNVENSMRVLDLLAKISKDIHISLMSQYFPVYKAKEYPEINRRVTQEEFEKVLDYACSLGFRYGWFQEETDDSLFPDFQRKNPFREVISNFDHR
ncbi:MAG: hypothetical protein DRN01_06185, partial [Thermoplasmata archaeon]